MYYSHCHKCHLSGDTMTVQDPVAMNLCSAVWAVTAYVVADLDDLLPRDSQFSFVDVTKHWLDYFGQWNMHMHPIML